MINYTFLQNPDHGKFKYAKKIAKLSKTKLYSRKTENVQIFFEGNFANINAKFLRES